MTLAAVALFADGPTTIRNVYSWRLKETERMKAIVAECTKLGANVEEFEDYCIIHPPADNKINDNVLIETYDDHRMAMTFSLAACGGVNVVINDPGCSEKTVKELGIAVALIDWSGDISCNAAMSLPRLRPDAASAMAAFDVSLTEGNPIWQNKPRALNRERGENDKI